MAEATAKEVIAALTARGWKLATAESCTAGLISWAVTEEPGSSAVFDRGFVTYSNAAKTDMLGVPPEIIETHGAVSEEVAKDMAKGARMRSMAQIAVSVTGIAGPGGSEFKPEGRVCFGLSTADGKSHTETMEFGAIGRANVRAKTTAHAMALMVQACTQGLPFSHA
ncbi:CinA family protein [Pseudooctadecabacter sp.]|uniref:CinA family protein n=1 Tax=Pseudooctadecabacter sp. TaxID=1966338 RepID=UPI0035C86678